MLKYLEIDNFKLKSARGKYRKSDELNNMTKIQNIIYLTPFAPMYYTKKTEFLGILHDNNKYLGFETKSLEPLLSLSIDYLISKGSSEDNLELILVTNQTPKLPKNSKIYQIPKFIKGIRFDQENELIIPRFTLIKNFLKYKNLTIKLK